MVLPRDAERGAVGGFSTAIVSRGFFRSMGVDGNGEPEQHGKEEKAWEGRKNDAFAGKKGKERRLMCS